MKRKDVYKLIDGELDYSKEKWTKERERVTRRGCAVMSKKNPGKDVESWILYMEHHLTKARTLASTNVDKRDALEEIRKVAGLAVRCMEYNETPERREGA